MCIAYGAPDITSIATTFIKILDCNENIKNIYENFKLLNSIQLNTLSYLHNNNDFKRNSKYVYDNKLKVKVDEENQEIHYIYKYSQKNQPKDE